MKNETLLHDEIRQELEELNKMDFESEGYKQGVDGVAKLMDKAIELEKIKVESRDKQEEIALKRIEMEEECKDRLIRNSIAVAGIIIPTLVTIWGTKASFQFEKDGTVTTIMGRGFINKLLPKK